MNHVTIISENSRRVYSFDAPMRLMELLSGIGVPIDAPCGGRGSCLKCRVIASGAVSAPAKRELELLSASELETGVRFACMTQAEGDLEITIDPALSASILTSGDMPEFNIKPWGSGLGVAVDIGTTTVAAYLYSLKAGNMLGVRSRKNPQTAFGADVISRIGLSLDGHAEKLQAAITDCVRGLISELTDAPQDISCAVLTGNTAMLYLLTGRSPKSIAAAPFIADTHFGEFISPKQFGLCESAKVYLMRSVSAYVGADITASMLAGGFYKDGEIYAGKPVLLADIGTNGEMALCANGKIYCCSTAAGPAFEGAGIYMGMNAADGAITRVSLDHDRFHVEYLGEAARGICGSGVVDALSCMLRAGIIDETGMLLEDGHAYENSMLEVNAQPAFMIPGTEVIVTQADVRAVQLAKSAICAGMLTLISVAGLMPNDVETLLIAGGFGSFISPVSAEVISLIPEGFARKARAIGNAAGAGACMSLLSEDIRLYGERLSGVCDVIELSTSPLFMQLYVDKMMFE